MYTILEPGLTKWKGRVRYFTVIFRSVLLFVFTILYELMKPIDAKTFDYVDFVF